MVGAEEGAEGAQLLGGAGDGEQRVVARALLGFGEDSKIHKGHSGTEHPVRRGDPPIPPHRRRTAAGPPPAGPARLPGVAKVSTPIRRGLPCRAGRSPTVDGCSPRPTSSAGAPPSSRRGAPALDRRRLRPAARRACRRARLRRGGRPARHGRARAALRPGARAAPRRLDRTELSDYALGLLDALSESGRLDRAAYDYAVHRLTAVCWLAREHGLLAP
ncbi:DUF6401 family natural product biosynthesis protein [Kitasatospora aburaviensis]